MACVENKEEIALFLIQLERERVRQEREEGRGRQGGAGGGREALPSYNMTEKRYGNRPVFMSSSPDFWRKKPTNNSLSSSARIVEELLTLDDLEVTDGDGTPLLWICAFWEWLNVRAATDARLAGQYSQRWQGTLPLERGE